jgi:hypothetical protein
MARLGLSQTKGTKVRDGDPQNTTILGTARRQAVNFQNIWPVRRTRGERSRAFTGVKGSALVRFFFTVSMTDRSRRHLSLLNDFLISKGKSPLGFLTKHLVYSTGPFGLNQCDSFSCQSAAVLMSPALRSPASCRDTQLPEVAGRRLFEGLAYSTGGPPYGKFGFY